MIQDLIDKKLAEDQANRKPGGGKWKPSMLGRCYRAHWWAKHNEPVTNPTDSRGLRVFKAGNLFHDFVQSFVPNHTTEVKVENEDTLGYADIVTEDTVYDIKSQHSRSFWFMDKPGFDIVKEKYPNWLQIGLYASLLKKENMCLVFISKDDLCIKEYWQPTKDWAQKVQAEFDTLKDFTELPKAEPRCYLDKKTGKFKECDYCNWKDLCKGGNNV